MSDISMRQLIKIMMAFIIIPLLIIVLLLFIPRLLELISSYFANLTGGLVVLPYEKSQLEISAFFAGIIGAVVAIVAFSAQIREVRSAVKYLNKNQQINEKNLDNQNRILNMDLNRSYFSTIQEYRVNLLEKRKQIHKFFINNKEKTKRLYLVYREARYIVGGTDHKWKNSGEGQIVKWEEEGGDDHLVERILFNILRSVNENENVLEEMKKISNKEGGYNFSKSIKSTVDYAVLDSAFKSIKEHEEFIEIQNGLIGGNRFANAKKSIESYRNVDLYYGVSSILFKIVDD